eukprot:1402498-Pleurochrysis_carterae.AAC.1
MQSPQAFLLMLDTTCTVHTKQAVYDHRLLTMGRYWPYCQALVVCVARRENVQPQLVDGGKTPLSEETCRHKHGNMLKKSTDGRADAKTDTEQFLFRSQMDAISRHATARNMNLHVHENAWIMRLNALQISSTQPSSQHQRAVWFTLHILGSENDENLTFTEPQPSPPLCAASASLAAFARAAASSAAAFFSAAAASAAFFSAAFFSASSAASRAFSALISASISDLSASASPMSSSDTPTAFLHLRIGLASVLGSRLCRAAPMASSSSAVAASRSLRSFSSRSCSSRSFFSASSVLTISSALSSSAASASTARFARRIGRASMLPSRDSVAALIACHVRNRSDRAPSHRALLA